MKIWKSLGYSLKDACVRLFSFLCTLITFVILISFKTDDQLAALTLLVKSKDYITLFLITMGLIALSLAMIVISYKMYKEYKAIKRAKAIKDKREEETRFISCGYR